MVPRFNPLWLSRRALIGASLVSLMTLDSPPHPVRDVGVLDTPGNGDRVRIFHPRVVI